MDNTKIIKLDLKKNEKNEKKELIKKKITYSKKWESTINDSDLNIEEQKFLLSRKGEVETILLKEIQTKIDGYANQDKKKKIFDKNYFVDMSYVIHLLDSSEYLCFYCREPIKILYETSRDSKQWTLERINNNFGHNKKNVEISCLSCNIRRRTMYYEKYLFTKQIKFVKEDN